MFLEKPRYNRRTVTRVTEGAGDVVTLADAKAFLALDHSNDDGMITRLIGAAVSAAEQFTGLSLLPHGYVMTMDGFADWDGFDRLAQLGPGVHYGSINEFFGRGAGEFNIDDAPLVSVTSVTTYDAANASSVVDAATYSVDQHGCRVFLNQGATWPSNLRDRAAVDVAYVAGYASGAAPADIQQAIIEHVKAMYECGGACGIPATAAGLLARRKLVRRDL